MNISPLIGGGGWDDPPPRFRDRATGDWESDKGGTGTGLGPRQPCGFEDFSSNYRYPSYSFISINSIYSFSYKIKFYI